MRLEYARDVVTLVVRDDGTDAPGTELGASGSGYGLLGMRERAELLGGSLEAGPAASVGGGVDGASFGSGPPDRSEGPEGKGFTVRLRVPA